nr:unnamed protein product [Callosobruchus analis]
MSMSQKKMCCPKEGMLQVSEGRPQTRRCKGRIKCVVCSQSHVTLMCPDLAVNKANPELQERGGTQSRTKEQSLANQTSTHVFLQTLRVRSDPILSQTAEELGLQPKRQEKIVHCLFGGIEKERLTVVMTSPSAMFLWLDSEGQEVVFRHKRVVFGLNSSPFLLAATLEYHLAQCLREHCESESAYSKDTIKRLQHSFYVDNCVTSLPDEKSTTEFIQESVAIMAKGQFDLRGWERTHFGEASDETINLALFLA